MLIGIPASVSKTKKSHTKSKTPIISNSYTQHVSSTAVKTIQYNTGQTSDETHADGELRNSHKERKYGDISFTTHQHAQIKLVSASHARLFGACGCVSCREGPETNERSTDQTQSVKGNTSHTSQSLHYPARDIERVLRSQTRIRVAIPRVNLGSGLGFFSIQEKALFKWHITLLSLCIIVYHCRYHNISCPSATHDISVYHLFFFCF
jgi:hypothetical protein